MVRDCRTSEDDAARGGGSRGGDKRGGAGRRGLEIRRDWYGSAKVYVMRVNDFTRTVFAVGLQEFQGLHSASLPFSVFGFQLDLGPI